MRKKLLHRRAAGKHVEQPPAERVAQLAWLLSTLGHSLAITAANRRHYSPVVTPCRRQANDVLRQTAWLAALANMMKASN